MTLTIYALASVVGVSLISLIGLALMSLSKEAMTKTTFALISLATGAMLGNAIIHLLPESFENSTSPMVTSLLVLGGIFAFFILEKFLLWRRCESHNSCVRVHKSDDHEHDHVHPVGYMSMIADGTENLIDGLAIGAAYMVSVPVGIATTLAVVLHEIPAEAGDFGVLLHAGFSRGKALLFNFLSGIVSVVGVLAALWLGPAIPNFPAYMAPFTAGCFLYMACSNLVPELHKELRPSRSAVQIGAMVLGVALMAALTFID